PIRGRFAIPGPSESTRSYLVEQPAALPGRSGAEPPASPYRSPLGSPVFECHTRPSEATCRPRASSSPGAWNRVRRNAARRRPVVVATDTRTRGRVGQTDLRGPRRARSLAALPRAQLPGVGAAAPGQAAGRGG